VPPRQLPSQAVQNERRKQAFTPAFCESCGSCKTQVMTRTDSVLYIRCWACAHVWSVPKPGRESVAS
jgi:hypothetical protein